MRKLYILPFILTLAMFFLIGCDVTGTSNPAATSGVASPTVEESMTPDISIAIQYRKGLHNETFDITGEKAEELFALLDGLDYSRETCDGLPEYVVLCADGKRFDVNLSGGWAWLNEKESSLSEETIAEITELLS